MSHAPAVVSSSPQPTTASRLKLLDYEGQPIEAQSESEEAVEGFLEGASAPYGQARESPWAWNESNPTQGMKVGWELRRKGKREESFAFSINPQSITRTETARAQLYATQGGFYVDDFGAGSGSIQISQMVASGRSLPKGFVTLREHVLRFYNDIYLIALGTGGTEPLEVFFYDNHLFHGVKGATELPEEVWFPPGGFSLERAVNLQNVWRFSLTMSALHRPKGTTEAPHTLPSGISGTKIVVVEKSQPLNTFARKQAGGKASATRVGRVETALLKLNPTLKKTRTVPIFNWLTDQQEASEEVKAMRVLAGEKVIVPS